MSDTHLVKIKVVAWNMNQRSPGGNWRVLGADPDLADADIAILCEATGLPDLPGANDLKAIGNGSTKGIGCPCPEPESCRRRRYSTAIAIPEAKRGTDGPVRRVEPLPLRPSRPGSWVAASVEIGSLAITAIALYGLYDEPYVASVRRSLSELAPLLEEKVHAEYLVLGGDLNILAGKPPRKMPHPGLEVLEEIKTYGLVDCLEMALPPDRYQDPSLRIDMDNCQCRLREGCTHTRTYYGRDRPHIPYQDDYLFASPALAGGDRLISCFATRVGPGSPSDHAPIVAVFEA